MILSDIAFFISSKLIPLALSIIGFGILIIVHEFGHFLFCKAFGIHTPTFSVGYGKPIIKKKFWNTNFQIASIPFGGFVEIAGLEEVGQGDQQHAKEKGTRSFNDKPFWQKVCVLLGGVLFNLIFAYIVFCTLFIIGDPSGKRGVVIKQVLEKSAAQQAGLQEEDVIIKINNHDLTDYSKLSPLQHEDLLLKTISENPKKEVDLIIQRNGKEINIGVAPGEKKVGKKVVGALGVSLVTSIHKLPIFDAIKIGIKTTNTWIKRLIQLIGSLFQRGSLNEVGGPVMILTLGFKTAQSGITPLLFFLALLSLNLAIFNLLPLGITDGGQLLFATIEFIIRRPVPNFIKMGVNLLSLGLFVFLAIYLTYKDFYNLLGTSISNLYKKILLLFR
jgi:regulator of sigma E protease